MTHNQLLFAANYSFRRATSAKARIARLADRNPFSPKAATTSVLARRHNENLPLTNGMKRARARLFDPRMPALTAAFAARIVASEAHGW